MSTRRAARVLAVHRYYWPDTPPYASLLREIARRWSDAGHHVEVLSTQPSYKPELAIPRRPPVEVDDGVTVRRLDLPADRSGLAARLLNLVRFPLAVALRILRGRYDVVMCSTAPPVVLAYAASLAARARGARFVYHCMDIHPEIGALSGEFRARPVFVVLRRLDVATCRRASEIVVLSGDMRDALLARDPGLADRIVVLNNFDLPAPVAAEGEVRPPLPRSWRTRLVFTGNLGRFQGLEALAAAILEDRPGRDRLELVLMGEGAAKPALEELVAAAPEVVRERVQLLPHDTPAAARALVAEAAFGVVSLTPGVVRYAYPSKTATYLAEGTPILALVETDSELATDTVAGGYGLAAAPGDPAALGEVLDRVAQLDAAERAVLADAALRAWKTGFAADTLLARWEELLRRQLADREAS